MTTENQLNVKFLVFFKITEDTQMARDGMQNIANDMNKDFNFVFNEQMNVLPLSKMSEPQEIANLVSFLFSNEQTSITGQALDINNGAYMS